METFSKNKFRKVSGGNDKYLCIFYDGIIYENNCTTNWLSDKISKDLICRGMKFVGSTIIYSYLQAIGIIYSHEEDCFMCYTK